jgi:hypothetical protein
MAGYNRPGNPQDEGKFINATSYNSQIVNQRDAYLGRPQNNNRDHGIASDTSMLFSGFEANKIIEAASKEFLSEQIGAFSNPDFPEDFQADQFKTFKDTIDEASQAVNMPRDGAMPGVGPTLATQKIEDALSPNGLQNNFVGDDNIRSRGFGWKSTLHNGDGGVGTIGSYLSDKYKFDSSDNTSDPVIQGENINTGYVDYDQP